MKAAISKDHYENYLRCRESYILSEIIRRCNDIVDAVRDENFIDVKLPIVNLEKTDFQSRKAYYLISMLRTIGKLISQLSWRDGSFKDNNKDIPWSAFETLGEYVNNIWKLSILNIGEKNNKLEMNEYETKLFAFFKKNIINDLLEFKLRLRNILIKGHLRFLNFPKAGLKYSHDFTGSFFYNSKKFKTKRQLPSNDPIVIKDLLSEPDYSFMSSNPVDLDVTVHWYESSPAMKTLFYPDDKGEAPIKFKRESSKSISGIQKIRAFIEPKADQKGLQSMLSLLNEMKQIDIQTIEGRTALLMLAQLLGEHSHALSASLGINLRSEVEKFPFSNLRNLRNSIKVSMSRLDQFQLLKDKLASTKSDNLKLFENLKKELLELEPVLRDMFNKIIPYVKKRFDQAVHVWKVKNPRSAYHTAKKLSNLDEDSKEILDFLAVLKKYAVVKNKTEYEVLLNKILCYELPVIEVKSERKVLLESIRAYFTTLFVKAIKNVDNKNKKDFSKKYKRVRGWLLEKKIVGLDSAIGLSNEKKEPVLFLEKDFLKLISEFQALKLTGFQYVESHKKNIYDSVEFVLHLLQKKEPDLLDKDPNIKYAIKFYIPVIDQSIVSLKIKANLFSNATIELLQELSAFRWVRNNEMHNMDQPIGKSLLRWYGSMVKEGSHKIRPSEIASYLSYFKQLIESASFSVDTDNTGMATYFVSCVQHDLKNDIKSRHSVSHLHQMTWEFMVSVLKNTLNCIFYANVMPEIKVGDRDFNTVILYKKQNLTGGRETEFFTLIERPKDQWTCLVAYDLHNSFEFSLQKNDIEYVINKKISQLSEDHKNPGIFNLSNIVLEKLLNFLLIKDYEKSLRAYLHSIGTEYSDFVTLHALSFKDKNIICLAEKFNLDIKGVVGGPFTQFSPRHICIYVVHAKKLSKVESDANFARFYRGIDQLLGHTAVVKIYNNQKVINFESALNAYRLFKLIQYKQPSLDQIKDFFSKNVVDINFKIEKYTVLHTVARNYGRKTDLYIKVADYLIKQGADPLLLDKHGNSVFHDAASCDDIQYCQFLLNKNPESISLPNKYGKLPVEVAALRESKNVVNLLFKKSKLSPTRKLIVAIQIDSPDKAKPLLEMLPEIVNQKDPFDRLPLFEVAKIGSVTMLKLLMKYNAKTDIKLDGDTLLHVHCESNYPNPQFLEYLINKGLNLDVNARNAQGDTPLHSASKCGYKELLKVLLDCKADVSLLNNDNQTALVSLSRRVRISNDHLVMAKWLIEKGVDLRQQCKFDGTILHIAAYDNHAQLAKLVLSKNKGLLNLKCTGKYHTGDTPKEVALEAGSWQILGLFDTVENLGDNRSKRKRATNNDYATFRLPPPQPSEKAKQQVTKKLMP